MFKKLPVLFILCLFCTQARLSAQCVAAITSYTNSFCAGNIDTLYASVAPGNTYQWYYSPSGLYYSMLSGAAYSKYIPAATGYYQVIVTNGACAATSAPYMITVLPAPSPSVYVSGSDTICPAQSAVLHASTGTGITYTWYANNNIIPYATSSTYAATLSGSYQVKETNSNGCSAFSPAKYIYVLNTLPCIDSVWPGDVNNDYSVDNNDVLALALAFGYTGAPRDSNTVNWKAKFCNSWQQNILGINLKHADCNGDGIVSYADTIAIAANYGDTHLRVSGAQQAKVADLPDLYFDTSASFRGYAYANQTITIPIKLGTQAIPMYNILGIAVHVRIAGLALNVPAAITYLTSWVGSAGNTLRFTKGHGNTEIDWAYARTDHNNISGSGAIAGITFTIPASVGYNSYCILSFDEVKIIDKNGIVTTAYNTLADTIIVNPTGIENVSVPSSITIVPNPSGSQASLQLFLTNAALLSITVADITGRCVWQHEENVGSGTANIPLPASVVHPGMYFVSVRNEKGATVQTLKWIKN